MTKLLDKALVHRKKIIYGTLLLFWMGLIFYFSSRDSTSSARDSGLVTGYLVDFLSYTGLVDRRDITKEMLASIHGWVRTAAHFIEFFILGILSFLFYSQFFINRYTKIIIVSVVFCLAYAIFDEIHQIFVPGRVASVKDVFVDLAGSSFGIALARLSGSAYRKIKNKTIKRQ